VTGSEDAEGLRCIAEETKRLLLEECVKTVSCMAFVLDGAAWRPFLPPAGSPAYKDLAFLATQQMKEAYRAQEPLLRAFCNRHGHPNFVASYLVMQCPDDGRVWSYCCWGDSTNPLLPRTDLIGLADYNESSGASVLGFATWEQVAAAVGQMLQPLPDTYPARFRADGFPSREQLARIDLVASVPALWQREGLGND